MKSELRCIAITVSGLGEKLITHEWVVSGEIDEINESFCLDASGSLRI